MLYSGRSICFLLLVLLVASDDVTFEKKDGSVIFKTILRNITIPYFISATTVNVTRLENFIRGVFLDVVKGAQNEDNEPLSRRRRSLNKKQRGQWYLLNADIELSPVIG